MCPAFAYCTSLFQLQTHVARTGLPGLNVLSFKHACLVQANKQGHIMAHQLADRADLIPVWVAIPGCHKDHGIQMSCTSQQLYCRNGQHLNYFQLFRDQSCRCDDRPASEHVRGNEEGSWSGCCCKMTTAYLQLPRLSQISPTPVH